MTIFLVSWLLWVPFVLSANEKLCKEYKSAYLDDTECKKLQGGLTSYPSEEKLKYYCEESDCYKNYKSRMLGIINNCDNIDLTGRLPKVESICEGKSIEGEFCLLQNIKYEEESGDTGNCACDDCGRALNFNYEYRRAKISKASTILSPVCNPSKCISPGGSWKYTYLPGKSNTKKDNTKKIKPRSREKDDELTSDLEDDVWQRTSGISLQKLTVALVPLILISTLFNLL